jgi:hypothetical protein
MLVRLLGKGLSKTGKKESSEVAKKGTELMGRRDEKFMGMAEEVSPKRLSGPAAKEAAKEAEKKGGKAGAAIAAGAAATGVAALASRDKEDKGSSSRGEGKGRSFQEDRPTRDAGRVSAKSEETKSDKKPSTFGAAFKEARSAGKDTFTFEGKKYTTEMASEKKAAPKADKPTAAKPTGVREGRNENIDDDTRKRARAFVEAKTGPRAVASEDDATKRMNKGGMVKANCGASVPPAQKAKK